MKPRDLDYFLSLQTTLDLWSLKDYVQMLSRELPRLVGREHKRLRREAARGDELEEYGSLVAAYELDAGVTTRLATGAAIVAIWATYEAGAMRCAERLAAAQKLKPDVRKAIRVGAGGKGTVAKKLKRYCAKVLHFELHPHIDWKRLDALYTFRNAIAHANGRIEDMEAQSGQHLRDCVDRYRGLSIEDGSLIVSLDFIARVFRFIETVLTDLDRRTDAAVRATAQASTSG